jgi:hypothetical protein
MMMMRKETGPGLIMAEILMAVSEQLLRHMKPEILDQERLLMALHNNDDRARNRRVMWRVCLGP